MCYAQGQKKMGVNRKIHLPPLKRESAPGKQKKLGQASVYNISVRHCNLKQMKIFWMNIFENLRWDFEKSLKDSWNYLKDSWKSLKGSWKSSNGSWKSSKGSWKFLKDSWKSLNDSWKSSNGSWKSLNDS